MAWEFFYYIFSFTEYGIYIIVITALIGREEFHDRSIKFFLYVGF